MKSVWFAIVIFIVIAISGVYYNNYLNSETDRLLELSDRAYITCGVNNEESIDCLEKIEKGLEKMSGLLCAFLDRKIIDEAEDAVIYAREMCMIGDMSAQVEIALMREKIRHIKNTASLKIKYIL